MRANVNDLLDQAEDPEKMIDQIIRDMESNIADARKQVAAMIAQEKELEYDRDETQKLPMPGAIKPSARSKQTRTTLPAKLLRRQKDYADNAALYDQQLIAQKEAVTTPEIAAVAARSEIRSDAKPARHPRCPPETGASASQGRRIAQLCRLLVDGPEHRS